ncbi:AN1-type zinc finger protein 3 isoform X2 [Esox lucius]|uniref:Zinc finger, AN1-type domain 3 n=1 Tax=Esox lucius TaxID=8010 RepID=A0AAY5KW35_ESOLU|nr:AN1-type zinc finger protein 3 isoform X2 [Esox lucius]
MGDTGSERSKPPSIPPRCPCGFWGSSETMNLCSKCFADIEKKQPDVDCASNPPPSSNSSSSSQSIVFCSETSSSQSLSLSVSSEESSPDDTEATPRHAQEASESENDASPEKQARVHDGTGSGESSSSSTSSSSKQRSRRRCHQCQMKLELVQQELGSCRCGYVFCMLHRLPEQHDCLFDHLGRGREEAVLKMVKLERKVGRSCQRIGEECS